MANRRTEYTTCAFTRDRNVWASTRGIKTMREAKAELRRLSRRPTIGKWTPEEGGLVAWVSLTDRETGFPYWEMVGEVTW